MGFFLIGIFLSLLCNLMLASAFVQTAVIVAILSASPFVYAEVAKECIQVEQTFTCTEEW